MKMMKQSKLKKTMTLQVLLMLLMSFLVLPPAFLPAQSESSGNGDQMLLAFQKSFARGSLSTKIQVLQDASEMNGPAMGPLYQQAVEFILDNIRTLKDDSAAQELTVLAVNLVGIHDHRPAAGILWKLFESTDTTRIRVAIMNALGTIAQGNGELITRLNTWMAAQNNAMRSGGFVDRQVVAECVVALGKVGNDSSYGLLFSASSLSYSDDITYKANEAMEKLDVDYVESISRVIEQNPPAEKLEALERSSVRDGLENSQKAQVAMKALSYALSSRVSTEEEEDLLRELRYLAARKLTELQWAEATDLVINHFNQTVVEVERGQTPNSSLLEAIACLGSMGTHEAAVRLSLYLEVLNAYVENGQPVDTQTALAVVSNLGNLGDRVAFDYLLYTGYLDYAPPVKRAAREALNNLKN